MPQTGVAERPGGRLVMKMAVIVVGLVGIVGCHQVEPAPVPGFEEMILSAQLEDLRKQPVETQVDLVVWEFRNRRPLSLEFPRVVAAAGIPAAKRVIAKLTVTRDEAEQAYLLQVLRHACELGHDVNALGALEIAEELYSGFEGGFARVFGRAALEQFRLGCVADT